METRSQEGPDKGWSWVIASAACFNSLVLAGIIRASGVLFVEFIKEFGVSREEASWPVVLCLSVLNLTGLLTGVLGHRFGVRRVSVIGSFIATIGVSCCYLTTSLGVITILFGGVFGVGYGLINTLMPVVLNEYFLNYRALASGIANAGSCFGSVLLPPLFEFLIDEYQLSGCFLLTGGIVFNTAIAGALMRPPSWHQKTNVNASVYTSSKSPANSDRVSTRVGSFRENDNDIKSTVCKNSEGKYFEQNKMPSNINQSLITDEYEPYSFNSEECSRKRPFEFSGEHNHLENVTDYISDALTDDKEDVTSSTKKYSSEEPNGNTIFEDEICSSIKDLRNSLNTLQEVSTKIGQHSTADESCKYINNKSTANLDTKNETDNLKKKDSAQLNSTLKQSFQNYENRCFSDVVNEHNSNLQESRDLPDGSQQLESINADTNKYSNILESSNDSVLDKVTTLNKEKFEQHCEYPYSEKYSKLPQGIIKAFKIVLTCPMFYITSITNLCFYTLYFTFVVIVVDVLLDRGVPDRSTKYVLFAFGLSDLLGRLCLGWITDRKFVRRSHFVMGCMSLIGLIFFSFPYATSYGWFIIISCFYGILLGCTMVVFPILLVDYLGLELHALAMGCLCFLNGVAALIRPFLIGYFRDHMGSYSNIFYLLGGVCLASSFLWLLERFLVKADRSDADLKHM